MLNIAIPIWELILRAATVYIFLLVLLRVTGKRQVGQLSPFDFVLLLILSNAVQNSMNGGDNSLLGGLISAVTLVLLNYGVGALTMRSRKIETLLEGVPEILIHNGKISNAGLKKAQLTPAELEASLRRQGCQSVSEVKIAILEVNGAISVVRTDPAA